MMRLRYVLSAIVLLTALTSQGAHAQATPSNDEQARTLFLAGQTYYEQGEYELAKQQFERAYGLSPRPQLLLNAANAAERAGELEAAIAHLEHYLREEPEGGPNRATLERRLDAMRRRLARQQASSTEPEEEEVPEEIGEALSYEDEQEVEPLEAPPPRRRPGLGMPAIIAYSVGGAGFLTFGVFGGLTIGEHRSVEAGCGATVSCTDDDLARLRGLGIVADVGLAIGVSGAIAGTVLWLLHRKRFAREERAVSISPFFGPGGSGALLQLTF